jgi:hypothetical protein
MRLSMRGAVLGVMLTASLVAPAMAQQQIVLSDLDKTGGLALQLALIRIDIAADKCAVTLPDGNQEKLDANIAALNVHLDISEADYESKLVSRGMDVYNKNGTVFCSLWADQVIPLIAALVDAPETKAGGAAAISAEIAAAQAAEEAGQTPAPETPAPEAPVPSPAPEAPPAPPAAPEAPAPTAPAPAPTPTP